MAVGALCKSFLAEFGVQIGGYVVSIGAVNADLTGIDYPQRFLQAESSDVRCPDPTSAVEMQAAIRQVMADKDTLGGVVEVVALNLPVGLGSHVHWDPSPGGPAGGGDFERPGDQRSRDRPRV